MNWIAENKDWIFSGIGVVIFTGIIGIFFRNKRGKDSSDQNPSQSIKAGANSTNIQGGKNVKVSLGDKDVRK